MKNASINFMKALAAMAVVFAHAKFPGSAGQVISALSRAAVVFFFIVSGYFSYSTDREQNRTRTVKKAKQTGKLLLGSALFYFLWEGFLAYFRGGAQGLSHWLASTVSLDSAVRFLVLNQVSVAEPLWFLAALLYCYLLWLLVNRYRREKLAGILSCVLLMLNLCGQILCNVYEAEIIKPVFRTAWLYAFPVFVLANRLRARLEKAERHIPPALLVAGTALGVFLTYVQWLVCVRRGGMEFYFGSVLCAFSIFVLAVQNPQMLRNRGICYVGEKLSPYMYILHWAAMSVVLKLAALLGVVEHTWFLWIYPVIVLLSTAISAVLLRCVVDQAGKVRSPK